MLIKLKRLLIAMTLLTIIQSISSAPKTWPYMKTYDIWDTNKTVKPPTLIDYSQNILNDDLLSISKTTGNRRKAKGES